MPSDDLKRQAAVYVVDHYIKSNMVVGLGVGSTAIHALRRLAERLQQGELQNIVGIPAAKRVEQAALEFGIPLTTLDEHPQIDLTFDGADEVDPSLNLIKGGGGALLREKVVAQASTREIIMIDESKLVQVLGQGWPIPVEVLPFALGAVTRFMTKELGGQAILRKNGDGSLYQSDNANLIVDLNLGALADPYAIAQALDGCAGVLGHGLFLDLTSAVVIAGATGIRVIERAP